MVASFAASYPSAWPVDGIDRQATFVGRDGLRVTDRITLLSITGSAGQCAAR
jgi:hypothetical protein